MLVVYPVAPYRLDLTASALRRLPTNEIDRWDGQTYRRVLTLGNRAFEIAVEQPGPDPALTVRSRGISLGAEHRGHILPVLSRMLGWSNITERDHPNSTAPRDSAGLRPYQFASPFEALVNALAGNQRSLEAAIQITNRLGSRFGPRYGDVFGFVRPSDVAKITSMELIDAGLNLQESENLLRMLDRSSDLGNWSALDNSDLLSQLQALPGVTKEISFYVARYGYGRLV